MINNILKKIEKANEVQKVELEKHEVELATLEDLKKISNDMIDSLNAVSDERLIIINAQNRMSKSINNSESIIKNVEKQLADYLKQIKDLGIEQVPAIAKNIQNEIVKSRNSNKKDLEKYIQS
jgi:seryl-tRNA synthetase